MADELEGADAPSLQDAFAKFRRGRRKTKPTVPASELKVRAAARRAADPAGDKTRLRKKFVEKLKTYVGAYQFATCPTAREFPATVEPGDLLFVKGTYFKGRKKPQKGDAVHVEVFLARVRRAPSRR
ncbi:hypothetical protein JL721_12218 [Aureococcus anophagefferens]|nr:hypothetical protein JL721_12218 [Aureococcus anophagefferens]